MYDLEEKLTITQVEAQSRALSAFDSVFAHGAKIQLDHFIVYYARKCAFDLHHCSPLNGRADFELGRLLACAGDKEGARMHLELVFSGTLILDFDFFL